MSACLESWASVAHVIDRLEAVQRLRRAMLFTTLTRHNIRRSRDPEVYIGSR